MLARGRRLKEKDAVYDMYSLHFTSCIQKPGLWWASTATSTTVHGRREVRPSLSAYCSHLTAQLLTPDGSWKPPNDLMPFLVALSHAGLKLRRSRQPENIQYILWINLIRYLGVQLLRRLNAVLALLEYANFLPSCVLSVKPDIRKP